MKILYIASVRIPNEKASGLAIMRQCEAFSALGHAVTLLRPYRVNHVGDDPFSYYALPRSFTLHTMASLNLIESIGVAGFYITRMSQMVASLFYVLRHQKEIDLIYARDPWMLILPSIFFRSTRMIWEAHQPQANACIRFMARRVARVVCISQGLRNFYATRTGRTDILVEPSGVNMEQFEKAPTQDNARDLFGVPREARVVGYIGKYHTMGEEKGIHELIQAFAAVRQKIPEAHLFIAGMEASETAQVRSMCARADIPQKSVTLVPLDQKQFATYVSVADVLVMNYPDTEHYRTYMSPTKLFAYMASGKLVVASDLPTVGEVADSSMVFLIDPSSVISLVEGLVQALMSRAEELSKRISRSREHVKSFSWHNRAKRILTMS